MPTTSTLLTFMAAALAVVIVPGPSVAYVMSRSMTHGRTAGMYSMLGLETGALLHTCAAAGGVAALVASSPGVYATLRYGGALYLLHLGIRELRAPVRAGSAADAGGCDHASGANRLRLYRDGILVDLLNPKSALFFLAFLPQFVQPVRGPEAAQVIALGCCFVALAVVCDSSYALLAESFGQRLRSSAHAQRVMSRVTGGVYLALAAIAAFG